MARDIKEIDRDIKAVRQVLFARVGPSLKIGDYRVWGAAWNNNPDLREQDRQLYRERGFAQLERDQRSALLAARKKPAARLKTCPTCRQRTLSA